MQTVPPWERELTSSPVIHWRSNSFFKIRLFLPTSSISSLFPNLGCCLVDMVLQIFFFPGCQGALTLWESPSSHMLSSVLQPDTLSGECRLCSWWRWSSLFHCALIIYAVYQSQDDKNTWNQWRFQGNVIFVRDRDDYSEKSKWDWTRGTKEQGRNEKPEPKLIYIWHKLASIRTHVQDLLKLLCSFLAPAINRHDCLIFFHELELQKHLCILRTD